VQGIHSHARKHKASSSATSHHPAAGCPATITPGSISPEATRKPNPPPLQPPPGCQSPARPGPADPGVASIWIDATLDRNRANEQSWLPCRDRQPWETQTRSRGVTSARCPIHTRPPPASSGRPQHQARQGQISHRSWVLIATQRDLPPQQPAAAIGARACPADRRPHQRFAPTRSQRAWASPRAPGVPPAGEAVVAEVCTGREQKGDHC